MKDIKILKDCRWAVHFKGIDFKKDQIVHVSDSRAANEMIEAGYAEDFKGKAEDIKTSDELQKEQQAASDKSDEAPAEESKESAKKEKAEETAAEKKEREKAEAKEKKRLEKEGKKK